MTGSALLGREPLSADDKLMMRAIQLTIPSLLKAAPLLSEQGSYDSRATSMTIGETLAIALALSTDTARLAVRWSKLHTLGADDLMIIPACLCCVAYLSLNIASQTAGCLGIFTPARMRNSKRPTWASSSVNFHSAYASTLFNASQSLQNTPLNQSPRSLTLIQTSVSIVSRSARQQDTYTLSLTGS